MHNFITPQNARLECVVETAFLFSILFAASHFARRGTFRPVAMRLVTFKLASYGHGAAGQKSRERLLATSVRTIT
jgi:hypothetical protein